MDFLVTKNNSGSLKKDQRELFNTGAPERNLWAAVVHKAFDDINSLKTNDRDSARWFFLDANSSFEWICKVLNLPTEAIKQKVSESLK